MSLILAYMQSAIFVLFWGLTALAFSPTETKTETLLPALSLGSLEFEAFQKQEAGMPERGQFLFIYSYQGEAVDPSIKITRNGNNIFSLNQLSATLSDTLVDLQTDKGDQINISIEFGENNATAYLHNSLASFRQGFWANQFSINFFLQDDNGNYVDYLGTMTITFYLIPPFDGFLLLAESSPIAPGETSLLTLQAIESTGESVIIPYLTTVRLQTGTVGARLGGISLPLFGIQKAPNVTGPYGILTNTTVLYEADADSSLLQGSSETAGLLAYSPYDFNKNGATALEVRVDEEDEDVIALSVITDASSVFPQKTGGQTSTTITVLALNENEPVEGVSLSLFVRGVPYSGGHDHNGKRDTGTLDKFMGVTNEEGVFTTSFTSSEIAGVEWVIVSSPQTTNRDSSEIVIGVSELEDFSTLETNKWRLTGNSGPTTYGKCSGEPIHHPQNHYINSIMYIKLKIALEQFYHWIKTDEVIGKYYTLGINDMSLPNGGIFDICSDWEPGHASHRNGIDVDIDSYLLELNNNISLNMRSQKNQFLLDKLVEIMEQNSLYWKPSEGFHFRYEQ